MTRRVRVAAAQLAPVFHSREATVAKACRAIADAARDGAELVAFPEAFVPGYPYWAIFRAPSETNDLTAELYANAVEVPSPAVDALCASARDAGCHVVIGIHERDGGTLYNSQLFIGPTGALLGVRRKLMPTSHERMLWGRGDGADLEVYRTELGTIGGLICYEHANALFRYAIQAQGEQIHVAGWPGGLASINDIIDAATRHYAFEAQAFVLSVTSVVTAELHAALDKIGCGAVGQGGGYTAILGPRGDYLAGPVAEGETILHAELDFARIDKMKAILDCAGHYARPDVLRLIHTPGRQRPYRRE